MSDSGNKIVSKAPLENNPVKKSLVLDTLPIAFYTTQASGDLKLTYMSRSVKRLTGFEPDDFDNDNEFWRNRIHPEDKDMVIHTVENVSNTSGYDMEYRWKCSDGEYKWFYDHSEVIYDYQGRVREVVGSWINITDRKVTEKSINLLIKKTSSVTGKEFFRTLVKNIAEILGVKYAFISKCLDRERTKVKTLAFWEKNQYGNDIEYGLDGTPCKDIISGKFCFYEDNVLDLYPDDEGLRQYNAKGFLGVPIYSSKNIVLGHLAVFHEEAITEDISKYFSILQIFALRAGSEIERMQAEESLRRNHDQLEAAYEKIHELKTQLEKENVYLKDEIKTTYNFEEIIGSSEALKKDVIEKVRMVAGTDATVLLRGETGTGKELIARSIHNSSKRADRPLVKVNCPAIPSGLIESELFGHEKGAFTGALAKKVGKFELADGGTVFLDELGDLPLDAQAKLLRVLQEREFERVGGNVTFRVDVRVIAATNRNLEKAVNDGKFRADLFYRLNVFPIQSPSLRERTEDIADLSIYFMNKYAKRFGKEIKTISESTIEKLKKYSWPGNIRELENVIERAVILSSGDELVISESLVSSSGHPDFKDSRSPRLEDVERDHIVSVLNQTNWQIHGEGGAAKILDMNPSTLRTRMAKLGIKKKTVQLN